uniref:C-type lectin domain-containing protein n=1 Tax=Romanomermis culicivorax TaxID=13658 RepID=A0A915IIQ3_ROMCU
MHYRTLNFPSVTFCPTNPFKASKVELLSPELKSMMDELNGSIYDTSVSADQTSESGVQSDSMSRSKRQAMNFDQLCPPGYFKIEGGCYIIVNFTTTWFKAYNICQSFGANLPIFTNFSNYLSFFRWHSKNYPEEIWVGLYSLKNVNWIWSNGCPYD